MRLGQFPSRLARAHSALRIRQACTEGSKRLGRSAIQARPERARVCLLRLGNQASWLKSRGYTFSVARDGLDRPALRRLPSSADRARAAWRLNCDRTSHGRELTGPDGRSCLCSRRFHACQSGLPCSLGREAAQRHPGRQVLPPTGSATRCRPRGRGSVFQIRLSYNLKLQSI